MDYINELNSIVPDYRFIPESCTNIRDFGIYTDRAITDVVTEAKFVLLETQITVLNEYSILAEADIKEKISTAKNKIKEAFKAIMEKVKGFFAKVWSFIKNIFTKTKKEIFSIGTKSEFDKAVKYFDQDYKGKIIVFKDKKENKDGEIYNIKSFLNNSEKYNNEILARSNEVYNKITGLYNDALNGRNNMEWKGMTVSVKDAKDILTELDQNHMIGYILYGNNSKSTTDNFGKEEIEAAIFSEIRNTSIEYTTIDSSNINKYKNIIVDSVYSDISSKWIGFTKNNYDMMKNTINNAIKVVEDNMDRNGVVNYASSYVARCKDIISILLSVNSTMNNIILDFYKVNVKLVCKILNTYWKLNMENKKISPDKIEEK